MFILFYFYFLGFCSLLDRTIYINKTHYNPSLIIISSFSVSLSLSLLSFPLPYPPPLPSPPSSPPALSLSLSPSTSRSLWRRYTLLLLQLDSVMSKEELQKSKEQLEEEKRAILSQRIQPLNIEGMDTSKLIEKAKELYEHTRRLVGDKYDLSLIHI